MLLWKIIKIGDSGRKSYNIYLIIYRFPAVKTKVFIPVSKYVANNSIAKIIFA